MGPRYAIYFVPAADTALYRFGATALGYDCFTGADIPTFDTLPVDADTWRELTSEPRRYGFHATLKAPFRLAADRHEAELIGALREFARAIDAPPVIAPAVRLLQRFIAIVPAAAGAELGALAASCVMHFDRFRAPLTEDERDRRLAAKLTAQQVAHVARWGYPYVLDEFRFHMTLTGSLAAERQALMLAFLQDAFARGHGELPVRVDRLALMRQDGPDARFVVTAFAPIG
jgi:putative phosphonate metabolism protein